MKRKIFNWTIKTICVILIVIFALIALVNIVLISKSLINKDKLPTIFGLSFMSVETDSMEPEFSGGDLIIIKECSTDELKIGDIASYYEPSVPDHSVIITHRISGITEIGQRQFQFKGDANNTVDSVLINDDEIVGRYLFCIPLIGKFLMYLATVPGMLICIVTPLVILYVINEINARKKKNQKES